MKINDTDIRTFNAKQLTVDFSPPSTVVSVDMFNGALIPSESETYTPLSGVTVGVLFRGNTRNEIQTNVSNFNAMLQKGVTLVLDGYEKMFKGFMTANSLKKTITKERYTAEFTFTGYWFSDTVTLTFKDVYEMKFDAIGNRQTPCRISITALEYIEQLKINGFADEIIISVIQNGATVVIDGYKGLLTQDGINKFKDVRGMMEFPYLKVGDEKSHDIIFSTDKLIVSFEYNPMWL